MPERADAPTFLTVQEAAQILRVTTRTIKNRIRDGRLPAKRLSGGQTILIEWRDLFAQLEDARTGAASEAMQAV